MNPISPYQSIDTPALLVDVDIVRKNIAFMQNKANEFGVKLRPHTKTHKMPYFAKLQLDAGARGITVAKVAEAEVMAAAGIEDIFIANEIVGPKKLERLAALHRLIHLIVGVDCEEQVDQFADCFKDADSPLLLRMEIEVGEARTGVSSIAQAVYLAECIRKHPGLQLEGVFCHEGHTYRGESIAQIQEESIAAQEKVLAFANAIRAGGTEIQSVSIGATPSLLVSPILNGITEIRPGTYIFMDAAQGQLIDDFNRCAATVLATVISRPTKERVALDAGAKALTAQRRSGGVCSTPGNGLVKGSEGIRLSNVFDEHGLILNPEFRDAVNVGDKIEVIPNHICPCVNLYDTAYLVSNGQILGQVPILGRGKTQ